MAVDLNAPILGLYGSQDGSIPLESIDKMRQGLPKLKRRLWSIPEAGHTFNADYRPSYHADSEKNGWQRILAWFKQYGVAPDA